MITLSNIKTKLTTFYSKFIDFLSWFDIFLFILLIIILLIENYYFDFFLGLIFGFFYTITLEGCLFYRYVIYKMKQRKRKIDILVEIGEFSFFLEHNIKKVSFIFS